MKKKIWKVMLAGVGAVMIGAPILGLAGEAYASTGGKTANDAITWVKSQVGRGIDYDGMYGNQCVDLVKAYYKYLGQSEPYGNGADYANNKLPAGWKRYSKSESTPRKGDILVYTGGYGGYGHVAIYESDYSTYHQNFNYNSYVEQVKYKYNGNWDITYWGVIRPDFSGSAAATPAKTTVAAKKVSATGVSITPADKTLAPGETAALKAVISPSNATNKSVTWSSSDTKVATVDAKGNVKAVSTGKSIITVKTVDGAKTSKATITVKMPDDGLAMSGGTWKYFVDGKVDTSYTGLAQNANGWWYVKKGVIDYSYTGISKSTNGKLYYVNKGKWDTSYTGFALSTDKKWYFVRNGRFDAAYTGLAYNKSNGGWFFAREGKYDNTYTGLAKSTNGKWYYVNKGRWDTSYTGFALSTDKKWYFVRKGRYDSTYTGLANNKSNGGWFFARNGKYDTTYTGLAISTNGKWYYVNKGRWDTSFTGITKSTNGKLYYAIKGKWATNYTGKVKYNGKTYNVKNGRVI